MNKNSTRNLLKIVKEICQAKNITCSFLSENWIIELAYQGIHKYIFGYNFELNSSTSQMVAQDKCATSIILKKKNVPVVDHQLFMNPKIHPFFDGKGNWEEMMLFLQQNKHKIVCKPTNGTGGNSVSIITNPTDLEITVHDLFKKHRSIALSPFYEIEQEYRVIVLDKEALIIYYKEIPFIVGNGVDTLYQLMSQEFSPEELKKLNSKSSSMNNFFEVLPEGEKFTFHWKHNLGLVAKPIVITPTETRFNELSKLAVAACAAINIRFASVDIIEVNGAYKVLEINSGVMTESFSRSSETAYNSVKNIYQKAIAKMFEDKF